MFFVKKNQNTLNRVAMILSKNKAIRPHLKKNKNQRKSH